MVKGVSIVRSRFLFIISLWFPYSFFVGESYVVRSRPLNSVRELVSKVSYHRLRFNKLSRPIPKTYDVKVIIDMIKPFPGEDDVVSWLKKVTLMAMLQNISDLASFILLFL